MADKVFPEGIRVFKPNEKAPAFVKGEIVLKKSELAKWIKDQPEEVRLSIKESQKGSYYLEVNNWQPKNQASQPAKEEPDDSLPF